MRTLYTLLVIIGLSLASWQTAMAAEATGKASRARTAASAKASGTTTPAPDTAKTEKTASTATEGNTSAAVSGTVGTNIIGSKEAPAVLNIVAWKNKEAVLKKPEASSEIVHEVLKPLDRDVLQRQIRFYNALNASSN